jgi:hypothetical protein
MMLRCAVVPYTYLEPEDIDATLSYAAWRLDQREEPLVVE